jgi:hypothetical protein
MYANGNNGNGTENHSTSCRGTGDFTQIPKTATSKRYWLRSAPSHDTCTRKGKNRVEPIIYHLPKKSQLSLGEKKQTLTAADRRKNRELIVACVLEVKLNSRQRKKIKDRKGEGNSLGWSPKGKGKSKLAVCTDDLPNSEREFTESVTFKVTFEVFE